MSSPFSRLDVHTQIESAQTLASRFYTDRAILDVEKTSVFRRSWQLVGTFSQPCGLSADGASLTISDPETFFTADVIGEPVVVVRDKRGALRAFSNVCRHRAGPIAQGCGAKNVLRCAYHGWTYALDGRLIGTPDIDGIEFFDRSTLGMVALRCETWEQFIFVNFDANAEPLAAFLGRIPELCGGFRFAGLRPAERRDYVVGCNWKVYVDNYLEGYHIPVAHPGLMREIEYSQYRTETFRYHSQQFAPIRGFNREPAAIPRSERDSDLSEESAFPSSAKITEGDRVYTPGAGGSQEALYFWIFPNLMLNIYPDNISTNLVVPLAHDKTLTVFEWFFQEENSSCEAYRSNEERPVHSSLSERVRRAVVFSDQVQQEDISLCEAVQRGLNSCTYDRGRYSPKRENGVHHFHLLWSEFLSRP